MDGSKLNPNAFKIALGDSKDDPGDSTDDGSDPEDTRLTDVLGEAFDAFKADNKDQFIECMKSLMR
jgi:hypothetical protein